MICYDVVINDDWLFFILAILYAPTYLWYVGWCEQGNYLLASGREIWRRSRRIQTPGDSKWSPDSCYPKRGVFCVPHTFMCSNNSTVTNSSAAQNNKTALIKGMAPDSLCGSVGCTPHCMHCVMSYANLRALYVVSQKNERNDLSAHTNKGACLFHVL